MFSVLGISPTTCTARLEPAERLERAEHGGGAGHVVLHVLHVLRRLDRDAAGVEGDALAHQHHRRAVAALVLQRDEPRLFRAALGHRQQRAHLFLHDSRLVQNGDGETVALTPALGPCSRRRSACRRCPGSTWMPARKGLAGADGRADPVALAANAPSVVAGHRSVRASASSPQAAASSRCTAMPPEPVLRRSPGPHHGGTCPRFGGRWNAARATPTGPRFAAIEAARRIVPGLFLPTCPVRPAGSGGPGRVDRGERCHLSCR